MRRFSARETSPQVGRLPGVIFDRSFAIVRAFVLSLGIALAAGTNACATVDAAKNFAATAVQTAPAMSLDFSGEPWSKATAFDDFETLTTRTPAARFPTSARVVFDKENLYVAIHSVQTGAPITATQTTNSVGFGLDDFVGVGIDTTGNGQASYFETTPRGVTYQQSAESTKFAPQ